MALKKSVTTQHGLLAEGAYHRAEFPTIDSDKKTASITLKSYKDDSEIFPAFGSRVIQFEYDMNGPNIYEQAYCHLKTLPEFSDATDC